MNKAPDSAADLPRLREKYLRMLELRERHDRARTDPAIPEPDPRPELNALATEFPGALREIDRLPIAQIRRRIDSLTEVVDRGREPDGWMLAQARFHRLARGALAIKRRLRGGRVGVSADLARIHPDAPLWAHDVPRIARPPSGRLMTLVMARLGEELGVTPEVARDLVFGERD